MKLQVSSILIAFFLSLTSYAQVPAKEETGFVHKYEVIGGLNLHTGGWGGYLRYATHKTYLTRINFELGYVSQRHPKQNRVFNPFYEEAKGYHYGKLNAFGILRPMVGIRRTLLEKLRERGVDISLDLNVGPSLGLLKPVFLEIGYVNSGGGGIGYDFISVEQYDPESHTQDNIYGRAPWSKGLELLQVRPGIAFKGGFMFEYAARGEFLKAIELGMTGDYYFTEVPLMANTDNTALFLNLYVNISFGQKFF